MIKLSIVVVLYNEFDLVVHTLRSIYENEIPGMEVIISDNSDKEGIKKVLDRFPSVIYKKNKKNLGYAGGALAGYEHTKGKYVLILTPDTTLLPHTIKLTLDYIEKHVDVAVVGCRIYSYPKILQQSVFHEFPNFLTHVYEYNLPFYKLCRFISPSYHPSFFSKKDHLKMLEVKHMIGAYMLMRKKMIDQVGFFDKRYFMYREETDLCKRLYDAGLKIVYVPLGGLIHHENPHKTIKLTQASPYYQQSTYLFFQRYYGKLYTRYMWFITIFSAICSLLYLLPIVSIKRALRLPSQSYILFDSWVKILQWQFFEGRKIVFK